MPSKTMTIGYVQTPIPAGNPVPALWWYQLQHAGGSAVGPEVTSTTPLPEIPVSAPAGTYTLTAGQRAASGAELGTAVTSSPFDLVADLIVSFVGSITVKVA